jgi:hypothetical protein
MQRSEQIAQVKVLLASLDSGVNVDAGGIRLNPTDSYINTETAQRERSLFFQSHPQVLGLSGDLPEPGSFITINDLDTRILATRDENENSEPLLMHADTEESLLKNERTEGLGVSCARSIVGPMTLKER